MKNFNNEFYQLGWSLASHYLYGTPEQQREAECVYNRFSKQDFNDKKNNFISGWTDHLMD